MKLEFISRLVALVQSGALTEGSGDEQLIAVFHGMCYVSVISCCQFDSEKIVSGSADKDLRIWSMSSGKCTHILSGHDGEVVSNADVSQASQ